MIFSSLISPVRSISLQIHKNFTNKRAISIFWHRHSIYRGKAQTNHSHKVILLSEITTITKHYHQLGPAAPTITTTATMPMSSPSPTITRARPLDQWLWEVISLVVFHLAGLEGVSASTTLVNVEKSIPLTSHWLFEKWYQTSVIPFLSLSYTHTIPKRPSAKFCESYAHTIPIPRRPSPRHQCGRPTLFENSTLYSS